MTATSAARSVPTEANGFISMAEGLRTDLRASASETEALGRIPDAIFDKLDQAGAFQMLSPAKYGGAQVDLQTYLHTIVETARGDMGVAWALNIINISNWGGAMILPRETADTIFSTPGGARLAGVFSARTLKSRQTAAGLHVEDGIWAFNSGINHANWDMLGVPIKDSGDQVIDEGLALIPCGELEILDDWDVIALRGSGSNSVRLRDYVVKPDYIGAFGKMRREGYVSPNVENELLYRISGTGWGALVLTFPIIGGGLGAIDHFLEKVEKRGIQYTQYLRQADAPVIHQHLGRATAKVNAALTIASSAAHLLEETARRGDTLTHMESFAIRRDCGMAASMVWEAVDLLASASGGSFIASSHPLNRVWRDVRAGTQHGAINIDTVMEAYGRQLCGLPSNMTMPGTE
ncbi:hypothetical protein L288_14365 [Sphingobium quisquiliarum P25]|uniref:Acyl-CoA dehydrogenase C-terminal domain-containing protein n=1 Tax=Sphingobium quisquiliarum P25 TaxID=1329909 RepID=T0I3Q0_9SPHN|nr:acyl-CoA dehydrogenase family protein [Sphingobium quisquiliarum]EQB04259.1 hypothetical protein L288_14365 [Sphingobium quisquiliarum P25]